MHILPPNRIPRRLLFQAHAQQPHDMGHTRADHRQAPELGSASEPDWIDHRRESGRGKQGLAPRPPRKRPGHDTAANHGGGLERLSDHWPRAAGTAAACASGTWPRYLRRRPRRRQSVRCVAHLAGVVGPLRRQSRRQARGRRRFADGGSSRAALSPVAPLHRRAVAIRDHTAARPCAARRGRELHHHGRSAGDWLSSVQRAQEES
jgi:hypothetical protein